VGLCQNALKEYKKAEAEFRQILQLNDDNLAAHQGLGQCLFDQGLFADALTEFKAANRLDTANADVRMLIGLTHVNMGEKKLAMKEAQMLDYLDGEAAATLREEINKMPSPALFARPTDTKNES
jgi:tetratricopeptide (TPR) repeat protein